MEPMIPHDAEHGELPSNRSFGLVFMAFFLIVALWPLFSGGGVRIWSFWVSGVFAALALLLPAPLAPLNRLWFKLGLLLGRIVSPIAIGIVFFVVVTPMGILMRLAGKDLLRLRLDRGASTYWIPRTPPGPEPGSLKNQF